MHYKICWKGLFLFLGFIFIFHTYACESTLLPNRCTTHRDCDTTKKECSCGKCMCKEGFCMLPPCGCRNDGDCPEGKECNKGTCAIRKCKADRNCHNPQKPICDLSSKICRAPLSKEDTEAEIPHKNLSEYSSEKNIQDGG